MVEDVSNDDALASLTEEYLGLLRTGEAER